MRLLTLRRPVIVLEALSLPGLIDRFVPQDGILVHGFRIPTLASTCLTGFSRIFQGHPRTRQVHRRRRDTIPGMYLTWAGIKAFDMEG